MLTQHRTTPIRTSKCYPTPYALSGDLKALAQNIFEKRKIKDIKSTKNQVASSRKYRTPKTRTTKQWPRAMQTRSGEERGQNQPQEKWRERSIRAHSRAHKDPPLHEARETPHKLRRTERKAAVEEKELERAPERRAQEQDSQRGDWRPSENDGEKSDLGALVTLTNKPISTNNQICNHPTPENPENAAPPAHASKIKATGIKR